MQNPQAVPDYLMQSDAVRERFARLKTRDVILDVRHVGKRFATPQGECTALDDVSFRTYRREFVCVIVPSGCGKSTLIRILAGLDAQTSGEVLLDGKPVQGPGADRGMVFQGYTLFPWLTVKKNVMFGLRMNGSSNGQAEREALQWLDLVGLTRFADVYPHQLSGGMKQRVAIARALANRPRILLMDEPFGALDPIIRNKAQDDLFALQRRLGITVVIVTHDIEEALKLGDTIAVMDGGRLLQVATPAEILGKPAAGVVEQLVAGVDRPLRLLALTPIDAVAEPGHADGEPIAATRTLRDAVSELLWRGVDVLPVEDGDGRTTRRITLDAIRGHARKPA